MLYVDSRDPVPPYDKNLAGLDQLLRYHAYLSDSVDHLRAVSEKARAVLGRSITSADFLFNFGEEDEVPLVADRIEIELDLLDQESLLSAVNLRLVSEPVVRGALSYYADLLTTGTEDR